MAAPTPTARATPGGIPLKDGYPTKITLSADTDIEFWEKSVQPPGIDGGDEIESSTMFNSAWRTMRARSLKTMTEISITAAYDAGLTYTTVATQINNEQTITVTFSDGSTVAFYGYLKTFEPQEVEEGEQPECELTIVATMWDPTNNVEEGPVVASVGSL